MSDLTEHAKRELELAGLNDVTSDYAGKLGKDVLELVEVFARQGHSGYSAHTVLDIFVQVASYKPLSDLTNDSREWNDISDVYGMVKDSMWQSKRRPDAFSKDLGHTYYLLDKPDEFFATSPAA